MLRLTAEAERRGTTVFALAEDGLRHILDERCEISARDKSEIPTLPKWRGKLLVDISNRDELYRIFDEDASFRY